MKIVLTFFVITALFFSSCSYYISKESTSVEDVVIMHLEAIKEQDYHKAYSFFLPRANEYISFEKFIDILQSSSLDNHKEYTISIVHIQRDFEATFAIVDVKFKTADNGGNTIRYYLSDDYNKTGNPWGISSLEAVFYSNNPKKIFIFYESLFDLKNLSSSIFSSVIGSLSFRSDYDNLMRQVSKSSNIHLLIKQPYANATDEIPGNQNLIIKVDNITKIYNNLKSKNVTFLKELSQEEQGIYFVIADPDGNKIKFIMG